MIKENGLEIGFEKVDAARAMKLLESNTMNRKVKDQVVQGYARDMREGQWLDSSTTPLKFDQNGVLVDGQHRLWAVIESGKEIRFLVARGVVEGERHVQDVGAKRSVHDILTIDGEQASLVEVAVANRIEQSFSSGDFRPTTQEQLAFFHKHKEGIKWALENLASCMRGVRQAGVLAPVVRAWYTRDKEKLARFLELLRTGMADSSREAGPILLRTYLLTMNKSKVRARNSEIYGKTERALTAMLLGEELKKLVAVTEEQFEIPNGKKVEKISMKPKARLIKGMK